MAGIETIHKCPSCGGTDITYDGTATVSVRVVDGVIQYALLAGAPEDPDSIFCAACFKGQSGSNAPSDEQADALFEQLETLARTPLHEIMLYQHEAPR